MMIVMFHTFHISDACLMTYSLHFLLSLFAKEEIPKGQRNPLSPGQRKEA